MLLQGSVELYCDSVLSKEQGDVKNDIPSLMQTYLSGEEEGLGYIAFDLDATQ